MPSDQPIRSRKYDASAAQASSTEPTTNSRASSSVGAATNILTRRRSRPGSTRIVTTHVTASATPTTMPIARSPERRAGVRARVDAAAAPSCAIRLLDGFEVTVDGRPVTLAATSQRLLALLALRSRPQPRSSVAGVLWMDRPEQRAAANLRSALWKLGPLGSRLVAARGPTLAIAEDVAVDYRDVVRVARALLEPAGGQPPRLTVELLAGDLLPSWDEDWALFERERLRQLRVHAIESLCRRLAAAGRFAEAVDAGLIAVAADDLRESAHRVLIEAYLGEGNAADARRQFEHFRTALWNHLSLRPSAELARLVGAV